MIKELLYPFNAESIIRNKIKLRKQFLEDENNSYVKKRIAILGGQTTKAIVQILELFLLNNGIQPIFYESEYNKFFEEGLFPNELLASFHPDIIYICSSIRNINEYPQMVDAADDIKAKHNSVIDKFEMLWRNIEETYHCVIIQNNFEYPFFRLMGNKDASDIHGRVNFITNLNLAFYEYAQLHDNFYICDINYISASYGLDKWSDPYYWYMYKYAIAVPAIPYLSFNVANIVKSIYGRNKKAFNLDLDNTLWGGIVGDDGAENIEIGQETSLAQTYSEFQEYIKLHKQIGVLLTVNSKNDEGNAKAGFDRPDSILKESDFVSFKANWNPKSQNLSETASELALLPESFVFVDDNPAEREIVRSQIPGVAIPEITEVEHYIQTIDKSGYFEVTNLSSDDLERNKMYQENVKRHQLEVSFESYEEYLKSLEMKGEIQNFIPMYMSRIAQLTNKSNQFNLTTKRYTQAEIENVAKDLSRIALYGKLEDKFGDNGVVSIVIGRIDGKNHDELHIELWLMSCRVLKRNMEFAMMDEIVREAKSRRIKRIIGYYYPTSKNAMVKEFYNMQGFEKIKEDDEGNTVWKYEIPDNYENKQSVIAVNQGTRD